MAIERYFTKGNKKFPIAIMVDFTRLTKSEFITNDSQEFQLGYGQIEDGHTFAPHIHKSAKRNIENTSEFIQVLAGKLVIKIFDVDEQKVATVEVGAGQGFIQFFGGHSIVAKGATKYFELKQGPYYGFDFDKYNMSEE